MTSLTDFLAADDQRDPNLGTLVTALAAASRRIAAEVRTGSLQGNTGIVGNTNVQGEDQKPLDVISNDICMELLAQCPGVAALVSEEVDDVHWVKDPEAGDYIVYFDPLDGSSNLDVNVTVGTIFSVAQVQSDGDRNVLLDGSHQICAGYAAYGPATLFVVTFGDQVDGFTLDEARGDFILTSPAMSVPRETSEIAINASNQRHWEAPVQSYISDCFAGPEGPRGRNFNMRWVGSMVADVHRILTRGGVFMYPIDAKTAAKGGRLRLMYEANPMSMIMEAAGGGASTGRGRIQEVPPTELHQRVAVIMGSADEVSEINRYHAG